MVQVLGDSAPDAISSGTGDVLVSNDFSDDAAIVRLSGDERRALVLTADVIAPLVDDAELFGEIAATNSISDVYAMGGRPLWALNLVFFPSDELPVSVLNAILRGGARACRRMGVAVVGGHTVRDGDIKFGLSVTGEVDLDKILSNRTARAGQALVLTKALGTGVIGTAIKQQAASEDEATAAIRSMTSPNSKGLEVAQRFHVSSATDVTGFGLIGHLRNILVGSGLVARLHMKSLPLLPGALGHAREGRIPGGSKSNLAFLEPSLRRVGQEDALLTLLAADAQTSGGLLLCVDASDAEGVVSDLRAKGLPAATVGGLSAPTAALEVGSIELDFE